MVRMCWMQGNRVIKVEPSATIALGSTFMRFTLSFYSIRRAPSEIITLYTFGS